MRRAAEHRSPFSGQTAQNLHHWTATSAAGRYFDPHLVLPLTITEHVREHQSWAPSYKESVDGDPVVLRLRRISHTLVRLGEHHEGGTVTLPAETVHELGHTLRDIADEVEVTR